MDSYAQMREKLIECEKVRDAARERVGVLEAALEKSRMDCINARLAFDEADGAHQSAERSVSYHIEERARLEALLNQHGISPGPEIRIGESKGVGVPEPRSMESVPGSGYIWLMFRVYAPMMDELSCTPDGWLPATETAESKEVGA